MNAVELINKIKSIALTQKPCKSFFSGDVYDNWNSAEVAFGSIDVGISNITNLDNRSTYTLIIYYGDRLLQDKSNSNELITDGVNTIQSVLNILNTIDFINVQEPVIYTPFEQQFMDYLAGVYCQVDIVTDSAIGECAVDEYTNS